MSEKKFVEDSNFGLFEAQVKKLYEDWKDLIDESLDEFASNEELLEDIRSNNIFLLMSSIQVFLE